MYVCMCAHMRVYSLHTERLEHPVNMNQATPNLGSNPILLTLQHLRTPS